MPMAVVANELIQGATRIMTQLYGPTSPELNALTSMVDSLQSTSKGRMGMLDIWSSAQGVLRSIKSDIEAGLIGSLRQQIAGEVLTDFIRLSRAALEHEGDDA